MELGPVGSDEGLEFGLFRRRHGGRYFVQIQLAGLINEDVGSCRMLFAQSTLVDPETGLEMSPDGITYLLSFQ